MNTRIHKLFLIFAIFFSSISAHSLLAWKEEFMNPSEAEKRWGSTQFNMEQFKAGDPKVKASMAASLIKSKMLVGMPLAEVRNKLGPQTGYYFSDMIPAYAIGDLRKGRKETWQIVLIPDRAGKIIEEVKIHKKCCYK